MLLARFRFKIFYRYGVPAENLFPERRTGPFRLIFTTGYKLFHNDSATRAGSGAIYVNNNICAELIPELFLDIDGCENFWLSLTMLM